MSGNKLYNLIANHVFEQKIVINGYDNLSLRKHALGSQYYLFELPKPGEVRIGSYQLINHHVSVYDVPTGALDLKSQYHYTAYFQSETGKQYRLHVFYDAQDNLVCQPLLSEIVGENSFEPVECFEEEAAFGFFANLSTKTLVTSLRATQQTVIKAKQIQYDELEQQATALSKQLLNNKVPYLALIERQLTIVDEIIQCSNAPGKAAEIKSYLIKLKRSVSAMIESPPIVKEVTSQLKKPVKTQKPQHHPKSVTVKKAQADKPAVTSVNKREESQPKFSQNLANLRTRLQQCMQLNQEGIIESINSIHAELIHQSLELELGDVIASVSDLESLRALENQVVSIGSRELHRVIFARNYHKARELRAFYPGISENLLPLALAKNDCVLLEFLLSEKIFSVHQKDIAISNTVFTSMVDYCFKTHSPENSKIDLLIKLIQLGASLMEIDSTNGIPFSANILQREHPLYPALIKVADKTLDNAVFFKQLNQVLSVVAIQPTCSEQQKQHIAELIEQNHSKITALNSVAVLRSASYQPQLREVHNQTRELLGNEMIDQLLADPVISAMSNRVLGCLQHLLCRLKPAERKPIRDKIELHFDAMKKSLAAIKDISAMPSLEMLKNECIKQMITALRIIALREELIDLQAELTTAPQLYSKKQVREHNNKFYRQKSLISEIHQLGEKLEMPFSLLNDYNKIAEGLSSMMHSLKQSLAALRDLESFLEGFKSPNPDEQSSSSDEEHDKQETSLGLPPSN